MPFDYLHTEIPESFAHAPAKAAAMYRKELIQRGRMLRRLGYDQEQVLTRLRTNLGWDWEANARPEHVTALDEELPALVEAVFAR